MILSPVARVAAVAAAEREAARRASGGTTASLEDHVRAIVEAALDAAVEAEHCPYPGCIVEHRDHPGMHVLTIGSNNVGGYLVSTPRDMPRGIFTEPLPESPEPEVPC